MHILTHFLHLLVAPGIAAGAVLFLAVAIRLCWCHGKSARMP